MLAAASGSLLAPERIEEGRYIGRRQIPGGICYRDCRPVIFVAEYNRDITALRRVLHGIVKKIGEDRAQMDGVLVLPRARARRRVVGPSMCRATARISVSVARSRESCHLSAHSARLLNLAMGVRSSWARSALNRRPRSKDCWRRASSSLKRRPMACNSCGKSAVGNRGVNELASIRVACSPRRSRGPNPWRRTRGTTQRVAPRRRIAQPTARLPSWIRVSSSVSRSVATTS